MNCVRWLRAVSGALVLAALSACATRVTYEGPRMSPTEEAMLVGTGARQDGRTSIITVDGHLYLSGGATGEGATRVYLKPGRHSVSIAHMRYPYQARVDLWFEAMAGRKYAARADRRGGRLEIWIEDTVTGEMVGGIDENPVPLISNIRPRD